MQGPVQSHVVERVQPRSRPIGPGTRPVVLVIDDNATNRTLARVTLEDEGFEVLLAEDGISGIAAFERARPHCVLLDIRMPGLDGLEVCQRIRKLAGGPAAAILFVTATHDVETFDRALVAGGDDFVTKPYRPSELVNRVQTALKLRRVVHERDELYTLIKEQRDQLQRIQLQMSAANEQLLLASIKANELADHANEARMAANINEQRFRTLVSASSTLVWQATAAGRIDVDGSWRTFTGIDPAPGDWAWLEAVHPDDRDRVRDAWVGAVASGSRYECEHRLRQQHGQYVWVVARAVRLPASGVIGEWIGMMTDVTARVQVDEARERFIGMLGHDLRTPLGAIIMGLELLDDLTEGQAGVVTRIGRSAQRIEAMIRDVLDFARGRLGGGIPVAVRPCDLGVICADAVAEMQQAQPARELSFEASGDLCGEWDPSRVEQVLSNLLGNAITHGTGGIRVTTRGDADEVVTTVHNHGAPIPAALIPTLFEPFTGQVVGTPRVRNGLGLGLYIASEIVHAHGGKISVTSQQGEGTTFVIRWPRTHMAPPQQALIT
jgi:signal transduction histidine kinase